MGADELRAIRQRSVPHPRSSNRTCRSPASGSPTGFTARYTESKLTARGFGTVSKLSFAPRHSNLRRRLSLMVFAGSSPITTTSPSSKARRRVRALSSASITQLQRSYGPVRLPPWPPPFATLRPLPSPLTGLPDYPNHLSDVPCPLPRRIERVRVSIASPLMLPSPFDRRVGVRIVTFEACSGFTHVTARRIAQPPKAAFVTRLQPRRLPGRDRSSATRSIDNSLGGTSSLVIRAFGAHGQIRKVPLR